MDIKEDLKQVVAANPRDSHPGWRHQLARDLQRMPEETISMFLPPNEPMRQVYQRVIRWAKTQTTEEVEKALKEVAL